MVGIEADGKNLQGSRVNEIAPSADMYVTERGSGKAVRKYEDSK